jgi:Predicted HD superfamily hydrolase
MKFSILFKIYLTQKTIDKKQNLSLLGQIVQDADRLDALGAIGTARAFYYGGSKKHLIYDDTRPRKAEDITEDNYREQYSVVNHFFEKLLILTDCMNTEKGREMAEYRTEFMKQFLDELFDEIKEANA